MLGRLAVGSILAASALTMLNQEPPRTAHMEAGGVVDGETTRSNPTPEDYYLPLERWLKAQGSPLSGKDFYEVGVQYKVDPDFLIAVAKAETNLGKVKQRGSTYNIGSVCSHDSTSTTCQATSYRQGIAMIAQTVNNQYLRRYTHISQLSRSHNPHQSPIYASSRANWFWNVKRTMDALKGKNERDYAFRR